MKINWLILSLVLITSTDLFAQFPVSFKWCSATAAHQVEGNNVNSDWWEFENTKGAIKNHDRSGRASDHWNQFESDIQLMKNLNLNTYRFSIEWAKIQPQRDQWDESALQHYDHVIDELHKNHIEPMITLHHFTLPKWIAKQGGWTNPQTVDDFEIFSEKMFQRWHFKVRDWITFNEPMVVITAGYLDGTFPPGFKNHHQEALLALKHILTAHAKVVAALRSPGGANRNRFGFAHHLRVFDPKNKFNPFDIYMAKQLDQIWNWAFTDALITGRFKLSIPFQADIDVNIPNLKNSQDFFGLNYYTRDLVGFIFSPPYFIRSSPPMAKKSDLNWEIYPEGLERILHSIHRKYPQLPIIITENGIADATDKLRSVFIRNHLQVVETALSKGLPIEGYCHWSLMDNFEWAEGFTPRFGLYHVDYKTQMRTVRPSALDFAEMISKRTAIKQ